MPLGLEVFAERFADQDKANEMIGRLFDTARPEAAFGQPVTQGEYTVITAAEVSIGMGLGYGGGAGGAEEGEEAEENGFNGGFGIGGGGGGAAAARPVAVIEIGPEGIIVEPIVDVTKIALAALTAFGTMAMMLSRMKKGSR